MSAPLAIATDNLTRRFGPLAAVDRVALHVPQHGIYGFVGPNGAGKSTTMRLLLGLLRPTAGRIWLFGEPVAPSCRTGRHDVGGLVEWPALYPHLSGRDNLEVTRRLLEAPPRRVAEVLELFGLAAEAARPVRTYSTGMRQLLALARAWMGHPRLLLLDEPTNGLDPAATRRLRALLRHLTTEKGVSVFLSTHVLSEVEQLADVIGIIHAGRLVFEGPLTALKDAHTGSLEDIFMSLITASEPRQ